MADSTSPLNFAATATLRKWPSLNNERRGGTKTYMVLDGTLDECIREFLTKAESSRHLYEIHTAPQSPLVTAILSAGDITELARLRDFL
jgi:hypothetical protein